MPALRSRPSSAGPSPAELVAAVAERSDGDALFIEELLRTWASAGSSSTTGRVGG